MSLESLLGTSILTPVVRRGRDFVYGSGADAVASAVKQILITNKGDLRWNPGFGNRLNAIRHKSMTDALLAAVQSDVMSALMGLDPRVDVIRVDVERVDALDTKLRIRATWRAVARSRRRSTVLTDPVTTEVEI